MVDTTVKVEVDLLSHTYTLKYYSDIPNSERLEFDEITLSIGEYVANRVLLTIKGIPIKVETVPDELYEDLREFLKTHYAA